MSSIETQTKTQNKTQTEIQTETKIPVKLREFEMPQFDDNRATVSAQDALVNIIANPNEFFIMECETQKIFNQSAQRIYCSKYLINGLVYNYLDLFAAIEKYCYIMCFNNITITYGNNTIIAIFPLSL